MKPHSLFSRRAAPASPDQLAMRESADYLRASAPADLAALQWHALCEQGLDAVDAARFQQWLAAAAAHQAAYSRLDQSLRLLRSLPPERTAHLRRGRPAPSARAGGGRILDTVAGWLAATARRPAALALCCVVLLAASVGGWHWLRQPQFEQAYSAPRGQRLDVVLPDGSQLALDTDTRVTVTLYRDRRLVRLAQGQAMFSVARDPARPFTVLAGPARVTVLGTRFAVRCRACDGDGDGVSAATEVEVEEGRVGVAANAASTQLQAGQTIQVSAAGLGPVGAISPASVAPWRKGLIRFSNIPLAEALREFERYAPLTLVVRDPEVARLRVGGSFRSSDPAAFAQALPHILPVRLLRRDDGMTEVVRKN
ncbi:iron dicitrate transport regulator FecR [Duganella sp. FT80W]|uniref:Iron dicitrate transport regulator FecR n=1 Tax=Duganella guangzhouensis TaxID=2666084 RepID=A0A6I2L073_9BURK|nr:FecR domain-containing protein [Duganella guangzhouensis]MRW89936.1 iron dicitrate transport regulator FecR [Duganella guangzhouensis]